MTTPAQFAQQYGPVADNIGGQIGVDPSVLLGQWGLETGWGAHVIPGTNNLGNIKDMSGAGVAATDNATGSNDNYMSFNTPQDFGNYYAGLIGRKYQGAQNVGDDPEKFAQGLVAGGYAQDPQYAAKLVAATKAVKGVTGLRGFLNQAADAIFPSAQAADDIFGGAKTATQQSGPTTPEPDDIFSGAATAQKSPSESTNTSYYDPSGTLHVNISNQTDKPPSDDTITNLKAGLAQGLTDLPVGFAQSQMHQGLDILKAFDSTFGTNLADKGKANVGARDAEIAQREKEYQDATPGSFAAGTGRVAGNIATSLIGGPEAAGGLLTGASELGANLLGRLGSNPGLANVGRLAGAAGGGLLQGAAYGSAAPVVVKPRPQTLSDLITGGGNDYDQQAMHNIQVGGLLGGALPVAGATLNATGQKVGSTLRAMVDPFTEEGQQRVAEGLLSRAMAGGPLKPNAGEIIPGSSPTLAEATGNPGIATVQRTIRDLNPNPFVQREQANAEARLGAIDSVRGSVDDLAAMKAARDANAADDYLSTQVGIPTSNTEYAALKQTPAFQSAYADAERMANNANATIEHQVANRTNANRGGAVGVPETYVSGTGLHHIKTALDDQIGAAAQAGERAKAANLLGVRDRLLSLMDQEIPGYANARAAYAGASKPIDAMQYLQSLNLTDATGNVTLAKVQNALNSIKREVAKPGVRPAKTVTDAQIAALTAVRDDLLRASNTGLGRSAGSSTAQNLATQNLLNNLLPGRLGTYLGGQAPGTITGLLGGAGGYLLGGPGGAVVGGVLGRGVGKLTNTLLRGQNESIMQQMQRLLLDAPSGLSALQAPPALPSPTIMTPAQQFMYPALIGAQRSSPSR
jgi:hypothetical protein